MFIYLKGLVFKHTLIKVVNRKSVFIKFIFFTIIFIICVNDLKNKIQNNHARHMYYIMNFIPPLPRLYRFMVTMNGSQ